ncbi:hypothetical protein C6502_09200 [Candidatus Poribacteria bacterium]|nr:MAG: hypothetical protein C6502_09200 [Candidatus Poribacteria bacterium]
MGLIEKLQDLSDTIKEYTNQDLDEANTEMLCFEPFIELLGYQRTLTDMQRQYPADMRGGPKPKTVDYAIKKDDAPIMIVECKQLGEDLDAHTGQLEDYFAAVQETRFGVLTDGRLYRFYTDLDKPNLMDSDPFLEFDLFDIQPSLVAELKPFTKSRFDLDKALAAARDLKYSKAIQEFLTGQLESPTEDFVNHIASSTNIAINTPEQRQRITEIIQQTLKALKVGTAGPPSPDPESDEGGEADEPSPPTGDLDSDEVLELDQTWIGKKIKAFTFEGDTHEVKSWVEFLARFCEILSEVYPNQFEEVLQLKPHHFSKNPDADFPRGASPKPIGGTGIYVQANINNNVKKEIVKDLVEHFGCNMPVVYIDEN